MYSIENLDLSGYRDEKVPNTLFRQEKAAHHLTILLPGLGYTSHMPLLYYPAQIMLSLGADVLRVEYDYNRREDFVSLSGDERRRWLIADVSSACRTIFAEHPYQETTLKGKSLGTLAISHLVTNEEKFRQAKAIWLTPLLRNETLRAQIKQWGQRSLFVIGSADPHYDESLLADMQKATNGETLVIEGGDHSLEIGGDVLQSLQAMERVIRAIQSFVTS